MCLKKSSLQIPTASPCARAAGGAPWERRAALQPLPRRRSRAASAELAHTAPPAVARWLWCGDAGTSAGSTPVSTTFANGAPQGFLWSFAPVSLAGGLLSAVAGFPLCAAFVRPLSVPAPLASVPRGRASTQGGRPATGATGLHTPPPKKEKHRKSLWKPVAGVAALPVCWLRPPPLLVVPALRVLVLPLLPAFAVVAPGSLGREFGEMALTFTM